MCGIRRHPHRFKFGIFAELPSIKKRRHAPFCGFAKYFSKYLTRCQGIQLLVYPVSVVVTAMLPSKTLVSQGKCCDIPVKIGVRGISPPSLYCIQRFSIIRTLSVQYQPKSPNLLDLYPCNILSHCRSTDDPVRRRTHHRLIRLQILRQQLRIMRDLSCSCYWLPSNFKQVLLAV